MDYFKRYNLAVSLIDDGFLIHCTNAVFDEFDKKYIKGGMRAKEGYGFYFTDMPYKALDYGDKYKLIRKDDFTWLNSNDKIDTKLFYDEKLEEEIAFLEQQLYHIRSVREYEYINSEIDKRKEKLSSYDKDFYFYVRQAIKEGAETYGNLEYLIRNPNITVPKLTRCYINNGYDGYYTDGIYTVFNFEKLNSKLLKNTNEIVQSHLNTLGESKKAKRSIILSETDLRNIISESVKALINRNK